MLWGEGFYGYRVPLRYRRVESQLAAARGKGNAGILFLNVGLGGISLLACHALVQIHEGEILAPEFSPENVILDIEGIVHLRVSHSAPPPPFREGRFR